MTTPKRNEAVAPVANCDDVVANIKPAAFVVRGPDHAPFKAVSLTEHDDITAALRRQKDALQGEVSRLRELAETLHEAVRHAQPFVDYAAAHATDPRLAQECSQMVRDARNAYMKRSTNLEPPTDGR